MTKRQQKFIKSNIPPSALNPDIIHVYIDPQIERVLKVMVKYGGRGHSNPVPFLNKLFYDIGLGINVEKYRNDGFEKGPFAELNSKILIEKILPRVDDLLNLTNPLGVEEGLRFIADSLNRRLRDYNLEPQCPTEWDSDEEVEWDPNAMHDDDWWNEDSSLADINPIPDDGTYGGFSDLSDMEDDNNWTS